MMTRNRKELSAYAWLVPFAYGALLCAASLVWLVSGLPFDHVTYERIAGIQWSKLIKSLDPRTTLMISAIVRELGGNTGIVAGILVMAVSATGYRKKEKWAWFTLWLLPFHSALDIATVTCYGALTLHAAIWDIALITVTSAALIGPAKRFFLQR
jgi:hypothetical protein